MASVNYSLKHKGVRVVSSNEAWVYRKNGRKKHNPDYRVLGKVEISMPNMILSATEDKKPKFKGNTCDLNITCKKQLVDFFFKDNGKRNNKSSAYLVIKRRGRK